ITGHLMFALSLFAALCTVLVLFWILGYVFIKGASGLNLDFFTKLPTPVGVPGGGMANAIVGSIEVVGMAALMAVPIGVATAIYLSEYGRGQLANVVRFTADVLSGVPAIVAGIVAYALVVSSMGRFSAFSGSVALALLMLPIIIRSAEEIFLTVPNTLREASLALGVPKWRTIMKIVIATAGGGLMTGIMLAIARVGGEAAPLLFTAFSNSFWNIRPDQPIATLPVQLFNYAISPYEDWHRKAWAAALVLIFMVLVLNVWAKWYALRNSPKG
ncbi:MAG: phosphate ABC transporter permease PstA, partial [Nitrospirota bacterium]